MWPEDLQRIPKEDPWVSDPLEDLARKYDTIEHHGWYRNLDPTLEELHAAVGSRGLVIDYSAGTGILVRRYLKRHPQCRVGFVLVDASPKFLRMALEKLGDDDRVAFRWIRFIKSTKKLQQLGDVLPDSLRRRGVDVVCSTNAIHLYYDLLDTLQSWLQFLRPGGRALIQSGNILNPGAPHDSWIIDDTVERMQPIARELAREDPRYAEFRDDLEDAERLAACDVLRGKYFLPVKPLSHYQDVLKKAGFKVDRCYARVMQAGVRDWADFLCAYDDGVLGWAGGCERIDGRPPTPAQRALRHQLIREALTKLFDGDDTFRAGWTYINCHKPGQ